MATLYSYRKVFEDERIVVGFRFDAGSWMVESREKRSGKTSSAALSPGVMEQLVSSWPAMKRDVGIA